MGTQTNTSLPIKYGRERMITKVVDEQTGKITVTTSCGEGSRCPEFDDDPTNGTVTIRDDFGGSVTLPKERFCEGAKALMS